MRFGSRFLHPMVWLVTGEVLVLALLLGFSWHLFLSQRNHPEAVPSWPIVAPGADRRSPVPARVTPAPAVTAPSPPPHSGPAARVPAVDLARLNRDGAALEQAQASVVSRLTAALRAYLERVVLPAVLRAERASTATSPATTQSTAASRKIP